MKMPQQEAEMTNVSIYFLPHNNSCSSAFICNWANSGKPEARIVKACYSVLKTQCRPNIELEFITSIAFEFFIISSTNGESRIKMLQRTLHFPQEKADLADSPHAPLTHAVGVRGLTAL